MDTYACESHPRQLIFPVHPRQLIFLRKSDYLGCAVLLCLVVCLTLLACFFLPSFSSLIKTCIHVHHNILYMYMYMYMYMLMRDEEGRKKQTSGVCLVS